MPFRVKDTTTGHEYTTAALSEGEKVLDKPAVDANGRWLPAKPNVNPAQPRRAKAAQPATSRPEEATE